MRNFPPPEFAFLLQLFERRDDNREQLQDDGRRDVRHDAQRKDGQSAEIAAAEHIDEAEQRALTAGEKVRQFVGVYAGSRDVPA